MQILDENVDHNNVISHPNDYRKLLIISAEGQNRIVCDFK